MFYSLYPSQQRWSGFICRSYLCRSVADLIGQNADYLVHTISLHLCTRRSAQQQRQPFQAIKVLQSVVAHGNEDVCHLVKDISGELLLSLDMRLLEVGVVWEGLKSVVQNCARWVDQRQVNKGAEVEDGTAQRGNKTEEVETLCEEEREGVRKEVGMETIAEFFRNYHKEKEKRQETECEVEGEKEEEEEEEEQLPCCEGVCVDVLRRSVHHLSHDKPSVRLLVLDAVQHCLWALQHHKVESLCLLVLQQASYHI